MWSHRSTAICRSISPRYSISQRNLLLSAKMSPSRDHFQSKSHCFHSQDAAAVDIIMCQSQSSPPLKMSSSHPGTKDKVKRAPLHQSTTLRKAKNARTAVERTANAPSTIPIQACIPNRLSNKMEKHAINVRMENANVLTANAPTAIPSHPPRETADKESRSHRTYRAVSDNSKLLLVIRTFLSLEVMKACL